MAKSDSEIHLNGCNVYKVEYDEDGNIVKALLKFGRLYMPLAGEEIKRLRKSSVKLDEDDALFGGEDGFIHHYYLEVGELNFTEEYRAMSKLIGVDWQEVAFMCAVKEADSSATPYADARSICRTTII